MALALLGCDGELAFAADGAPLCNGTWVLQPASVPFDPSQLDPAMLSSAFAAGFVLVGSICVAGICFRLLLNMIR